MGSSAARLPLVPPPPRRRLQLCSSWLRVAVSQQNECVRAASMCQLGSPSSLNTASNLYPVPAGFLAAAPFADLVASAFTKQSLHSSQAPLTCGLRAAAAAA